MFKRVTNSDLENKMDVLETRFLVLIKKIECLNSKLEVMSENIYVLVESFNIYKADVIKNVEFIIDHAYKDTHNYKENVLSINAQSNEAIQQIGATLLNIQNLMGSITDDNVVLRQKLLLEERVRSIENDIDILQKTIANKLKIIDNLL
uniref:Uncharacterized protein n=1 Tax=viral metagenome TaxID=1070528 RepID=A0A6C0DZG8_9ZZZZ